MEPGFAKRLMGVLRAVYHMLRRGLCRKRLMLDLHLLLGRGKLAGRALRNLVAAAAAHHHHPHAAHLFAARAAAAAAGGATSSPSTALSFAHDPSDVEFSCTATPSPVSSAAHALFPFRIRGRGASRGCDGLNFAEVARVLEMMNAAEGAGAETPSSSSQPALPAAASASAAGATPSPMLALSLGRSPAGVRHLRVTDSPFPVDAEGVDDRVCDDFINRFYEQLRMQQANATPDNCVRRRG